MYGGSTGGWEAMAAQVFYPDEYNGCWAACPDPIDFRAYTVVDIYKDENAYCCEGPLAKVATPGASRLPRPPQATVEQTNRLELVLGTKSRSGEQWDIWEAVYSPVGADGYPKRDLGQAHRRHRQVGRGVLEGELRPLAHPAARLGRRASARSSQGKLHIYVGDMDNYYLNNAVYLAEDFLKTTRTRPTPATSTTATAPSTAGTATTRGRTRSRACATTRCSCRRSSSASRSRRPRADITSWRY